MGAHRKNHSQTLQCSVLLGTLQHPLLKGFFQKLDFKGEALKESSTMGYTGRVGDGSKRQAKETRVGVCMCVEVREQLVKSHFSSSTVRVPGTEFKLPDLAAYNIYWGILPAFTHFIGNGKELCLPQTSWQHSCVYATGHFCCLSAELTSVRSYSGCSKTVF